MYKYTKNIPMPSLSKENYPYNAKITEFLCDFCETPAFAHNKNAKFCSCLCRHNAYLIRKEIAKCESDVKITEKSRDVHVDENLNTTKRKWHKVVGSRNVQNHFRKINIKITLKSLKDMFEGEVMQVGNYAIRRINFLSWMVRV